MMRVELNDIYKSSWGVLSSRRELAEKAPYGKFDEIYDKAIAEDFYTIEGVALAMDCCTQTATKRLKDSTVRFIEHKGRYWYQRQDADAFIESRNSTKG